MKNSKLRKIIAGVSFACAIAAALPLSGISQADEILYGDANCDSQINMADVVLVMQSLANPPKYGLEGTDKTHITKQGQDNADVAERGSGITNLDALSIQKYLLDMVKLPESYAPTSCSTTTVSTAAITTTTSAATTTKSEPQADITYIHLKNSSVTVEGKNASAEGSVVTISHSGTYMIDGTLDDGQIIVNIPDETADAETVKLFLNSVNITGKSAPAILVSNAENTSINIVDGSENTISDGDKAYSGNNAGLAVIEAKDDITIKGGDLGNGVLTINANIQNAVSCNNDIKINGGVINVNALNEEEKTDGISAKKSITIKSGTLKVKAEGDGIKSSKEDIEISGGTVSVKAGNDAVQASTAITISDGNVTAGGDRGFRLDENGKLSITGGDVFATATDYQVNGNEKIDMNGTTQKTWLFSMAEEQTKDTTITYGETQTLKPVKKYSYALISSHKLDLTSISTIKLGEKTAVHDENETSFVKSGTICEFGKVRAAE
ncbi:MAG: carbohydrate-binding domain-containing protein [Ruminococcus sp.]|nr:carbohydrate-binding domain-containing protein [Ruminococcus sp.]